MNVGLRLSLVAEAMALITWHKLGQRFTNRTLIRQLG